MLFFALVVLTLLSIMCHSVGCAHNKNNRVVGAYIRARREVGASDGRSCRQLVVVVYALATMIGVYSTWRLLTNGVSNVAALLMGAGVQKLLMFVFDSALSVIYK